MKPSLAHLMELERQLFGFRDIYQRASKGSLTKADISKLCNCPQQYTTYFQCAEWLLETHQKKISKLKKELVASGDMFDFPNECAIVPSIMVRGGLFGPMPRSGRRWLNKETVASWGDVELTYTGITLIQSDFDVLLCFTRLLRDAQKHGKTERISTESGTTVFHRLTYSEYGLLKELKRSSNNKTYEWLQSTICRLKGQLTFSTPDQNLSFPILGESTRNTNGASSIDINENFIRSLGLDNFSLINMDERLALKSDTAKWLHGFIASHKGGSTISVERLMKESKSKAKRPRDFIRKRLIPALEELLAISVIQEFTQTGHLISWIR